MTLPPKFQFESPEDAKKNVTNPADDQE